MRTMRLSSPAVARRLLSGRGRPLLAIGIAACLHSGAFAQSGGVYNLTWNTFDGGGATFVTGGNFSLGGTIGQPDAGAMSGGTFTLAGGFWQALNSVSGVEMPVPPGSTPAVPLAFSLHPPSPNPARGSTEVVFDLPEARAVRLEVYNLQGARVRVLADNTYVAGSHRVTWNGTDEAGHRVGTGVYYLRLDAGASRARHKIVVVQ
jgi:hypothetical protein